MQQHFRDAGARAKISVNLERPAQIKKIWQRALLQKAVELAEGEIAVADARPERNAPRITPARAAIAAPFQQNFCRRKEIGFRGRDLRAGIQREQRRHVAMIIVRHIHVFEPFLELAVLADLIGRDLLADGGELRGKFFIRA